MPADTVTNVVIAGLGGQGVIKASDILAEAAFRAGHDVKKSELHGMSQRGGAVSSDVRFGPEVASPMVPDGEADVLLVLAEDQLDVFRWRLAEAGTLILPGRVDADALPHRRTLNVALLGVLSACLDLDEAHWLEAIRANLRPRHHRENEQAFRLGREAGTV